MPTAQSHASNPPLSSTSIVGSTPCFTASKYNLTIPQIGVFIRMSHLRTAVSPRRATLEPLQFRALGAPAATRAARASASTRLASPSSPSSFRTSPTLASASSRPRGEHRTAPRRQNRRGAGPEPPTIVAPAGAARQNFGAFTWRC